MATRAVNTFGLMAPGAYNIIWTGLLNGDDGLPIEAIYYENCFVHVTGTFGAGGAVQMQASNDMVNWAALGTPLVAATPTANHTSHPRFIRPLVTAGDGTTNLTATMACHRHF